MVKYAKVGSERLKSTKVTNCGVSQKQLARDVLKRTQTFLKIFWIALGVELVAVKRGRKVLYFCVWC